MFDRLRLPFFIAAGLVLLVVIGLEAGSALLGGEFDEGLMRREAMSQLSDSDLDADERKEVIDEMVRAGQANDPPPGLAISYTSALDGLLLFSIVLMALSLLIPEAVHGKLQGIATLIVSFLCLLASIVMIIKAFVLLLIMVALFLAPPFGTLAYLARWGFFDTGSAAAILGASMFLKLVFVVLLALSDEAFLVMKRQVLMYATTIVATFLIGFLHGFVPGILVHITDAFGAIVVGILILIWALALLIGSIVSIVKAVV